MLNSCFSLLIALSLHFSLQAACLPACLAIRFLIIVLVTARHITASSEFNEDKQKETGRGAENHGDRIPWFSESMEGPKHIAHRYWGMPIQYTL